jgi:hypothetical protein
VVVDGRIAAVRRDGCRLLLDAAERPPIRVDAPHPADSCAWTLPASLDGVAAAAGTLHADGDTLRLSANGVQVTPVQVPEPDS